MRSFGPVYLKAGRGGEGGGLGAKICHDSKWVA